MYCLYLRCMYFFRRMYCDYLNCRYCLHLHCMNCHSLCLRYVYCLRLRCMYCHSLCLCCVHCRCLLLRGSRSLSPVLSHPVHDDVHRGAVRCGG